MCIGCAGCISMRYVSVRALKSAVWCRVDPLFPEMQSAHFDIIVDLLLKCPRDNAAQGISFEYYISRCPPFKRDHASPSGSNSPGKRNYRYLKDHACRCSYCVRRKTSKIQGRLFSSG